ncbi:hypothetical protein [Lyngbya sp. PCC 8106]|uniref:hypothetical protein n=1 Tax=Lyngbya sp. (strain PCC 8106) TaxID=313612 RepID=UPI0000EAABDB|nr:hypothetical protein [Lyngbya sp. PCC 8106]EAW37122.1 hypothetical protein L8106_19121 [Lyngbya sp. PCC 8106]
MNTVDLITLYRSKDITETWKSAQSLEVINHPQHGLISPNKYRAMFHGKPCPYCGQKMKHGNEFKTNLKKKAIELGYQYIDKQGEKYINNVAGSCFFHPNYVTLDHKLNKARFPEKLFDYDNLQIMCWRCNHEKGDNNAFDIQHTYQYLDALAEETLERYQVL